MRKPLIFLCLVGAALAAAALFGGLDLVRLRALIAEVQALRATQPLAVASALFVLYVVVTAFSLPLSVPMTLAAGAFFGLWGGVALAAPAASLGATFAFLAARHLARDWARLRLGRWSGAVDRHVAREGAMTLFSLRLVPVVPFFAINLAFGLTAMRATTFWAVSLVGMLPGAAAYCYAGTQLAAIERLEDILSPRLIGAFVVLALLPWAARAGLALFARMRRSRRWPRPRRFDADLVVIGGGAAGLVAAYVAAAAQAKVVLIAEGPMGGDCLNFGCVPSKALIAAARAAAAARAVEHLGVRAEPVVDFPAVIAHLRRTIAAIAPKDSEARYRALGVEVIRGRAMLRDPYTVEVAGRAIVTRNVVLATGADPVLPDVPGLAAAALTTETFWNWLGTRESPPCALLILGGGPVGCELAQALAQLGAGVTLIEAGSRLLPREEPEAAALVAEALARDGVRVLCNATLVRVEGSVAHLTSGESLDFDGLLVAAGRRVRGAGMGLEALGISVGRVIEADAFLRTVQPNIFVAGDAAGPMQLTAAAGHQGWIAAANALAAPFWRFHAEAPIPAAIFTTPEIARVGLTEAEARARGMAVEITTLPMTELDRAIAEGQSAGFVKLLSAPGRGRILGATVVGGPAGEILAQFTLAMRHGLGLGKILATPQVYPGWSEAARATAGLWRRNHPQPRLARLARRFHDWRRG